jgi:hypothetical protein
MSTATVTIPQAMEAIANDPSLFISRMAAPTVRPDTIGTDVSGTAFKGTFFRTDWQGMSVAGRSLVKAPGSSIKQVNVGLQDQTITIPLREAQTTISVALRDRMDAKGIQSFEGQIAAPALTNAVMLEHEQRLASLLGTTTNWGGSTTGAAGLYWDDPSYDVVQALAKACAQPLKYGKKANKIVLGWASFFALKQNPYFKQLGGDIPTGFTPAKAAELISELISLNLGSVVDKVEVLILSASQNTAELGQAASNSFIDSNFAWVGHVAPQEDASLYTRSALYTFEAQPFALREDIIPQTNEYSYTAYQAAQVTVVEGNLGFCFDNPVQTPSNYGG